jgi:3-isopropylmalate/(R)-2-methylmalate dehydratase small subunit
MKAFTLLHAKAMPLALANVDTDQIIPARYLGLERVNQVDALFRDLRFCPRGELIGSFPMNQERFLGAKVLVAYRNFGCGSSRENAVSTLLDNGFECIIAPSFGDIFYNNCFQNGVLPIVIDEQRVMKLIDLLTNDRSLMIDIDLYHQSVGFPDGSIEHFEIDGFRKDCLLRGLDAIDLTLSYASEIEAYERDQFIERQWQP